MLNTTRLLCHWMDNNLVIMQQIVIPERLSSFRKYTCLLAFVFTAVICSPEERELVSNTPSYLLLQCYYYNRFMALWILPGTIITVWTIRGKIVRTIFYHTEETLCTQLSSLSCKKWVHRKCSGIKGSMYKVMKTFICRGCVNPVTSTGHTSIDVGVNANLELVDKFYYLGGLRC